MALVTRNDPCHCNSGKKYKNCHLDSDLKASREQRSLISQTPYAERAHILPDKASVPLYPWENPFFNGVGKYTPEPEPELPQATQDLPTETKDLPVA
jgi:hypothetical protein